MRNNVELQESCACLIKALREKAGLSITKISELMGIDKRTWKKYEDGISIPNIVDFVLMFDFFGTESLHSVLALLFPDHFKHKIDDRDTESMRNTVVCYIRDVAPSQFIHDLGFLISEEHDANICLQMQGLAILDHLPSQYRYAVAKQIVTYWEIASTQGQIMHMSHVPNVSLFADCLNKKRTTVNK